MSRLQVNNLGDASGTINPITLVSGSAATASWSSVPTNMPVVASPNIVVLVIEPNTSNEEIVYVTAYTSGATTATVSRAQEGTSGITHTSKAWVSAPTARDFQNTLPAWAAGNTYSLGQLVSFRGSIYQATSSFTAGASFAIDQQSSRWTNLSANPTQWYLRDFGAYGDDYTSPNGGACTTGGVFTRSDGGSFMKRRTLPPGRGMIIANAASP